MVTILYFARLRDRLGTASENLDLPEGVGTVTALTQWLYERGDIWREELGGKRQVLVAINQELVGPDTPIAEGDEIAFFPPVTGG